MQHELEITFPNVSHDELRQKIKSLGAKCIQERTLMKRVIFENPKNLHSSYFRVRNEGNKITCSYKELCKDATSIDCMKEVEVEVSDFESMKQILTLTGLRQKAFQESYRETWTIGDEIFFMLDEWPGIHPFIEIEGISESIVREYTKKLGFEYENGVFGAVDELYFRELQIPHTVINQMPEITFKNPPKKSNTIT